MTDSTARRRSLDTSDFTTYPRAPASSAAFTTSEESCWLRIRISVRGASRRINRAASSPFRCGMLMSSTTTSGLSCLAASTASWPSTASPQTSNEGCVSSSDRTPRRTISWSSAISTRTEALIEPNSLWKFVQEPRTGKRFLIATRRISSPLNHAVHRIYAPLSIQHSLYARALLLVELPLSIFQRREPSTGRRTLRGCEALGTRYQVLIASSDGQFRFPARIHRLDAGVGLSPDVPDPL